MFEKRFGPLPLNSDLLDYAKRCEVKKQWDRFALFELGFIDAIKLLSCGVNDDTRAAEMSDLPKKL